MMNSEIYPQSRYEYPTVVLPGMNHASFLHSNVPESIRKYDLRANISIGDAITEVATVTSAFLVVTQEGHNSTIGNQAAFTLDYYMDKYTKPLVTPIIKVF